MAVTQRPLALRRDLIRIFGEDRLVAVIRTSRPDLARAAAHAMSEAGGRLVGIPPAGPHAVEVHEQPAPVQNVSAPRPIPGAGTVRFGRPAEPARPAERGRLVHA